MPADAGLPGAALDALTDFLDGSRRLFVLTGAGCSTDSGIPDYRDDEGEWKRRQPIRYAQFTGSEAVRRRYWARSMVGWPRMAGARPNEAHAGLAALEAAGRIDLLVTQNVDGLHQAAGSRAVLDLHGRIADVICLDCGERSARARLQDRLRSANPAWAGLRADTAPDGDADLEADTRDFVVPACEACGGLLKPDVVFFGESVPPARVERAYAAVARSEAVLVVGSSLMVFSGLRFVRAATKQGVPVAILNRGRTRADDAATLKVEAPAGRALAAAAAALGAH